MVMDQDDELKAVLSARDVPQAPPGLSTWIIAETQGMAQEKVRRGRLGWFDGLRKVWRDLKYELFTGFYTPQPAFVMAVVLLLGFSIGMYGESFNVLWGAVPGITTDDLSGFMVIGDRFTAQEF
jgi:hypothetical protein